MDTRIYGAVVAHREGQMVEVVLSGRYDTMEAAQERVDRWTRRHGHRTDGTNACGLYAYADRITRPGTRVFEGGPDADPRPRLQVLV